jgi:hypothetical protein
MPQILQTIWVNQKVIAKSMNFSFDEKMFGAIKNLGENED